MYRSSPLEEFCGRKIPYEAESIDTLQDKYRAMLGKREGSGTITFESGSPRRANQTDRRFLTVEEAQKKTRTKTKRNLTNDLLTWKMPTVDRKESSALEGLSFVVLEGNYGLDEMDAEGARQRGWWDSIKHKIERGHNAFHPFPRGSVMLTAGKSTNFVLGGIVFMSYYPRKTLFNTFPFICGYGIDFLGCGTSFQRNDHLTPSSLNRTFGLSINNGNCLVPSSQKMQDGNQIDRTSTSGVSSVSVVLESAMIGALFLLLC